MKSQTLIALVLCLAMSGFAATGLSLVAQEPTENGADQQPNTLQPSNNQRYEMETAEQLQRLVAPIALYPDPIVASILAASSYPQEIEDANNWLAPRRNLSPEEIANQADKQSWDASVKSLLAFPPILQNLASNLSWTSELGDANYNQSADVMTAIQEMRRQAKKAGTLKSNDQIKVMDKKGYITIEPANRESNTVYVPAFDPWAAYGYPIEPWPGWVETPGVWWGGPGLYFGVGFGVAPFAGYGWGWNNWGFDWYNRGIFWGGRPYFGYGPAYFDRWRYYRGYPGFARPFTPGPRIQRGFVPPRSPGLRSGPFGGFGPGGPTRGFSARGRGSFGGFRGGGFPSGGFRGGAVGGRGGGRR